MGRQNNERQANRHLPPIEEAKRRGGSEIMRGSMPFTPIVCWSCHSSNWLSVGIVESVEIVELSRLNRLPLIAHCSLVLSMCCSITPSCRLHFLRVLIQAVAPAPPWPPPRRCHLRFHLHLDYARLPFRDPHT